MKKRYFLIKLFLLGLLIWLGGAVNASAETLIKPTKDLYVYDKSDYLSKEQKDDILTRNEFYTNETKEKPQIAVVFIDNKDKIDIDSYANKLAEKWGIGNKKEDNGVLVIFAKNGGKNNARIEIGYGLEDVITDSKSSDILEANKDLIKSNKKEEQAKGIYNTYKEVSILVDEKYGYDSKYESNVEYSTGISLFWWIIILVFLFGFSILLAIFGEGSSSGGYSSGGYSGGSSGGSSFGGGSFGGGGSSI